jgi:bacteriocin biosynthesis cyclodehydratase domain-containing protein
MAHPETAETLRALATQLIEREGEVIVKRGRAEIRIRGERAADLVGLVLETASNGGATPEQIADVAAGPDRAAVAEIVEQLRRRRILVPLEADEVVSPEETSLDVFYWHFGDEAQAVADRLNSARLAIHGVNHISARLAASLAAVGADGVDVFDVPLLRNLSFFGDEDGLSADAWPTKVKRPSHAGEWERELETGAVDCLIATSDFGGLESMRKWNRMCVEHGCMFLPVVLQDLIGYVGPLVVPGQTACFECLRARQNSNMTDPEAERAAEYGAYDRQRIAGFHPSMASVLGDIASIELLKWFGIRQPLWRAATLIEVNLLAPFLQTRRVLKIPRCTVCSRLNERPTINLMTGSFMDAGQDV